MFVRIIVQVKPSFVQFFAEDAQPGGQPDAPIHGFYLASVPPARRLPYTLGRIESQTKQTCGSSDDEREMLDNGGHAANSVSRL